MSLIKNAVTHFLSRLYTYDKVTGHPKIKFFGRVSPISTRLFVLNVPLNARVSAHLNFKNCEILNLNNRRLGCLYM